MTHSIPTLHLNGSPLWPSVERSESAQAPPVTLKDHLRNALQHPDLLKAIRGGAPSITVQALAALAKQETLKHDIQIWPINGQGEALQRIQKQRLWQEKTRSYRNENKYWKAFTHVYVHDMSYQERVELSKEVCHIFELNPTKGVNVTPSQASEFCSFVEKKSKFKTKFDNYLNQKIKELTDLEKNYELVKHIGLTTEAHVEEIKKTQAQCHARNSYIGYFHPYNQASSDGIAHGNAHIETYLVTPDKILNIVPIDSEYPINKTKIPNLFTSELEYLCQYHIPFYDEGGSINEYQPGKAPINVSPQATDNRCATIGMASLEVLLKNNAAQLKEFGLTAYVPAQDYIDQPFFNGEKDFSFFLPPPEVLYFSQSSLYIKLMRTIVESDNEFTIVSHTKKSSNGKEEVEKKYKVKTLLWMFNNNARIEFFDNRPVSHKELILFRQRWLKQLDDHVLPRHNLMFPLGKDGNPIEKYKTERKNAALHLKHLEYLKTVGISRGVP